MGRIITKEFEKDLYLLISETYVNFLEDNSPVQSGNLKRSWVLIKESELIYTITNDAEYAKFLDEGTGIYGPKKKIIEIKPKTKQALSFNFGGNKIVVRSVKIKGIKPLQMIQKVASSKKVQSDFDAGLEKLFKKHYFNR